MVPLPNRTTVARGLAVTAGPPPADIRQTAGIADAAAALPWRGHIFSGDINGLEGHQGGAGRPFLLASLARILYPMGCLACERPRPCFGWAHDPEKHALEGDPRGDRLSEPIMLELR